jgi:hypothetical protein
MLKYIQIETETGYNRHSYGRGGIQVHRVLRERGPEKTALPKKGMVHPGNRDPLKVEPQEHNRLRFWGAVPEFEDRILRVVTLSDKKTIHNAFPDRGFKP